jgi:phospholipid transport system transporter-binding protein
MQLPATLTMQQAAAASRELDAAAAGGSGPFTVDASALAAMDTAAIAVLLQARRASEAAGRPFAVSGTPAKLVQLAQLYGVADLLGLDGSGSGSPSVPSSGVASAPAGSA